MGATLTANAGTAGESAPGPNGKTTVSEALRHPIRVRILEALNTHDVLSPVEFLHKGFALGVPGLEGKALDAQMSNVSYHFRVLTDMDCILLVATRPVRGTEEHFYRAKSRAYFTNEEWSALDREERAALSKTMFRGFLAQAEGALLYDTFDLRVDRSLAWIPFRVDERGWSEMVTSIASCFAEVEQIRRDAEKRLEGNPEATATPVTFGIFGFESPMIGDSPPFADAASAVEAVQRDLAD